MFFNKFNFKLFFISIIMSLNLCWTTLANDSQVSVEYQPIGIILNPTINGQELQATSSKTFAHIIFTSYNVAGTIVSGGIVMNLWKGKRKGYKKYAEYLSDEEEYADLVFVYPNKIFAVGQKKHVGSLMSEFRIGRNKLTKVREVIFPSFYATGIHINKPWSKTIDVVSSNSDGLYRFNHRKLHQADQSQNYLQQMKFYPASDALFSSRIGGHAVLLTSTPGASTKFSLIDKNLKQELSFVNLCLGGVEAPGRFVKYRQDLFTNVCPGGISMVDYHKQSQSLTPAATAPLAGRSNGLAVAGFRKRHRWACTGRGLFGRKYALITSAQGEQGLAAMLINRKTKSMVQVGQADIRSLGGMHASANNVTHQKHLWNKATAIVSAGKGGVLTYRIKMKKSK